MLIDDNMHGESPNISPNLASRGHGSNARTPEEVIAELKERLRTASKNLKEQQEEYK